MSLERTFARRLRWHRRRQGKSQAVIAGLAGLNAEYVGQIERGERTPSLERVGALAAALRVPVADLVSDTVAPSPVPADVDLASQLHRSLLLDSSPRHPPQASIAELRARVDHAWDVWQAAPDRYSRLAVVVPDLISEVVRLSDPARVPGVEQQRVASDAYGLLRTVARRISRPDLALVAADRGHRAAEAADDPIRVATARWNVAHALLAQNEPEAAEDAALGAIDEVGTYGSRDAVAMRGALWLTAAVAAARCRRMFVARERVTENAGPLAEQTGETNIGRSSFGPTNVAVHLVNIELEDGHAGAALTLADRIDPAPMASRERHTSLALDLARGHALRFDAGASLLHLLQAERSSAEELRYNPVVPDTVRRVMRHARPALRAQVTDLIQRVGIEEQISAGHTLS